MFLYIKIRSSPALKANAEKAEVFQSSNIIGEFYALGVPDRPWGERNNGR